MGVGEDNQAVLIGLIHFLMFIQLAAIRNEIKLAVGVSSFPVDGACRQTRW